MIYIISLNNISFDDKHFQVPMSVFRTWEDNYFCQSDIGPFDPQTLI